MKDNQVTEKRMTGYRVLMVLVKYCPVITAFFLWLHTVLSMAGVDDVILDHLFSSSIPRFILLLSASYAFGFCRMHRIVIWYNLLVTLTISYNNEIGFCPIGVITYQVLSFIVGMFLIFEMVYRRKFFIKCWIDVKETYKWMLEDSCR